MIAIDVSVIFYSHKDEDAFFGWVKRIPCVKRFDPVTLYVHSKVLSNENLRELTALLFRYGADMSQLRQFCRPSNEHWFEIPTMYWYKGVFGGAKNVVLRRPAL